MKNVQSTGYVASALNTTMRESDMELSVDIVTESQHLLQDASIFIDDEAEAVDKSPEESSSKDEMENDFIERRHAEANPLAHYRAMHLMDNEDGLPPPEEIVAALRERHKHQRDAEFGPVRKPDLDLDITNWTHDDSYQIPAAFFLNPIHAPLWRLRVKVGHEYDVVRTVIAMLVDREDTGDILSVFARNLGSGEVYVEAPTVSHLTKFFSNVAFVKSAIPPVPVPLEDNRFILAKPANDRYLEPFTWARIKSKGRLCGRLAWIVRISLDDGTCDLWVGAPQDKKRSRRNRKGAAPDDSYGVPCFTFQRIDGMLILEDVPTFSVVSDVDGPKQHEIDIFKSPTFCLQPPLGIEWARLQSALDTYSHHTNLMNAVKVGEEVKVIKGDFTANCSTEGANKKFRFWDSFKEFPISQSLNAKTGKCIQTAVGSVGELLAFTSDRTATVSILVPVDTHAEIEMSREFLLKNWTVGDVVVVVQGQTAGTWGWVVRVDWDELLLDVVVFDHSDATGQIYEVVDMPDDSRLRERRLNMRFVTAASFDEEVNTVGVLSPETKILPRLQRSDFRAIQWMEVEILTGPHKGYQGRIDEVHPDGKKALVRITSKTNKSVAWFPLTNIRHQRSQLVVSKYLVTPKSVIALKVAEQVEKEKAEMIYWSKTGSTHGDSEAIPSGREATPTGGPIDEDFWGPLESPTVHPAPSESVLHLPHLDTDHPMQASSSAVTLTDETAAREASNYGRPAGELPGCWLLHSSLLGKKLDVVIRNSYAKYSGKYEGNIGSLQMPIENSGSDTFSMAKKKNTLKVSIGKTSATTRSINLWMIYPLTTTQFDSPIPAEEAKSVLDVAGTIVTIIGPDTTGDSSRVGMIGEVGSFGLILIGGASYSYSLDNICRSDRKPRGIAEDVARRWQDPV
ncbi:hypothetical protein DFH07DRAFT_769804 [Mycena maculata]|uniref:NGN domain-containing protein n=1 Tax=Mycena maculata TaxID=230809 RepID=A0AAD7JLI8_9AGAR|nr:hypothetical protein DFH07DRAFT_769804 [Mycena maculata]